MRFIFDLDYTLLNTEAMRESFRHILADAMSVTKDQFESAEEAATAHDTLFNLDRFLHALLPLSDDRDRAREYIDSVMENGDRFLYSDAIQELHRLAQHQHELVLLTFGDKAWQQYKIEHTQIPQLIPRIEYVDTKKSHAVDLFNAQDIVCINDKGTEIDELNEAFPHVTYVWVARQGDPYSTIPPKSAHIQVNQLSDISL
jgi:hypothetical protein